ncbi:acyltransferase domain-containing protein [Cereibacter sp. SYSU M97828]|nr:acyltransferase domain-containing protein [Cereibacter flavus]
MLGLLFPGQSAQGAEALRKLLPYRETAPVFAALEQAVGMPLDGILNAGDRLFDNALAQPLVCALELAAAAVLDPAAEVCAGYSIGELAAYGFAGSLTVPEVLRLARIRAEAMDAASDLPQMMVAVRGTVPALPEGAYVAIRNAPDRVVVAGGAEAVRALTGGSVTVLPVRIASHTLLMAPAMPVFRRALEAADFRAPSRRVLAGIDGAPVLSRDRAIDTLSRQLCQTVEWEACMIGLEEGGCTAAVELPPGSNLSRMLRDRGMIARAFDDFQSADGLARWIAHQ